MMSAQQVNVDDIISDLVGRWKYASLDLNIKNEGRKDSINEYIVTLISIWDSLDKLPLGTVENIVVELDGLVMRGKDVTHKILRTNLEQYLKVRLEQGEEKQE
jgi:hypothetical protein